MYLASPAFGLLIHHITPSYSVFIFTVLIVGVLLLSKNTVQALVFAIAVAATNLLVTVLKLSFAIPRPADALVELSSYAFPSGHAATGACLAIMLSWLFLKKNGHNSIGFLLAGVCILLGFVLGYSRILIYVHTPFQVLAGFCIGGAVASGCIYLERKGYFSFLGK